MHCFQAKAGQVAPQWYVIDATDQVVGRLAAQIAPILMGKHRPTYTPHVDTGDFVIVLNVDKVVFTGQKWQQKVYQRYSGYPGGQKEEAAWKLFERHPERILNEAIRRMMPKNKLGRHMMSKLKLYAGSQHPHQAQQPVPLEPKAGRPAASGLLLAPEVVVNPPRRKHKKAKAAAAPVPAEVESQQPAPTPEVPAAPSETTEPPAES
jgi:large subunit ribosomal protein L13